ncbi:MAG: metabolite traffic protein EboE [Methyloprofundus sp.]|nr:metabolite traffic protein EboE [Methyloprofundus sp.]
MAWLKSRIGYCSNVHPGESSDLVEENIQRYTDRLRQYRSLAFMQHGLWLSKQACTEYLSDNKKLVSLKQCLKEHHLFVVTLNAFPTGNFHAKRVKQAVYRPHWGERERLDYTLMAAEILASLLPENQTFGTLSSLPLGYAKNWTDENQAQALGFLCEAVLGLSKLEATSGKHIQLCLEMEPGCVLQETPEIIALFRQQLPPVAERYHLTLSQLHRYLGICFDICHQAVMYENIRESLCAIVNAGISIGKIQISSALRVNNPNNMLAKNWLSEFAESRYLHQVTGMTNSEGRLFADDLELALVDTFFNTLDEWRIHFHVPVHVSSLGEQWIGTTSSDIKTVFSFLSEHPGCQPHLELETYSWGVLPEQHRPKNDEELIKGMQAEFDFIEKSMEQYKLLIRSDM